MRLTDQALVAVTVARAAAAAYRTDARATVADLLVGLATEPDGRAGEVLRARSSAAAALASRAGNVAATLATLDEAVATATSASGARPPGTLDLLGAALTIGGDDLFDLLAAAGYSREDLSLPAHLAPGEHEYAYPETLGWDVLAPAGAPRAPDAGGALTPVAQRVCAQVRAVAGGAVDVLLAVALAPDAQAAPLLGDPEELMAAAWRLRKRGEHTATPAWDLGLDAVLAGAFADALRAALGAIGSVELIRAAVEHGGAGPAMLLAEVERTVR